MIIGETISVQEPENKKNLFTSILLSTALPGSGEMYLGSETSKYFLWSELALWFAFAGTYGAQEAYLTSAHSYAKRYADADFASKDIEFLNLMADYRSRNGVTTSSHNPDTGENYNLDQQRLGNPVDIDFPDTQEYYWNWGTSENPENTEHWDHYKDILKKRRISEMFFKASIGALVVNRIISIVNVIRVHKNQNYSSSSPVQIQPIWGNEENGIIVSWRF